MVSGKDAGKVLIYRLFLKLAKTLRKKQKIIRKKSNGIRKGCREGSHLQIVLKTGTNPEKKTKKMKNTTPSPIHCKAWQNTHEIKHLAYASLYAHYHCFPSGFVFYFILFCFFFWFLSWLVSNCFLSCHEFFSFDLFLGFFFFFLYFIFSWVWGVVWEVIFVKNMWWLANCKTHKISRNQNKVSEA